MFHKLNKRIYDSVLEKADYDRMKFGISGISTNAM